jgi:hypothetical protein
MRSCLDEGAFRAASPIQQASKSGFAWSCASRPPLSPYLVGNLPLSPSPSSSRHFFSRRGRAARLWSWAHHHYYYHCDDKLQLVWCPTSTSMYLGRGDGAGGRPASISLSAVPRACEVLLSLDRPPGASASAPLLVSARLWLCSCTRRSLRPRLSRFLASRPCVWRVACHLWALWQVARVGVGVTGRGMWYVASVCVWLVVCVSLILMSYVSSSRRQAQATSYASTKAA